MPATTLTQVLAALDELGVQPSKSLGQNFLIDANIRRRVLALAELTPDDHVLEIGPGLGALSGELADTAARLTAIEKDTALHAHLSRDFAGRDDVRLLCADALDCNMNELMATGINKVVANLPYSVASRVLVDILQATPPPERIVITIQHEVGVRLTADAGSKAYGLLSIWAQRLYHARLAKTVSANCFYPRPRVASAVVVLERRTEAVAPLTSVDAFYRVTRTAFAQRRKQLQRVLTSAADDYGLTTAAARELVGRLCDHERVRPEQVTVPQWCALANALTLTDRNDSDTESGPYAHPPPPHQTAP